LFVCFLVACFVNSSQDLTFRIPLVHIQYRHASVTLSELQDLLPKINRIQKRRMEMGSILIGYRAKAVACCACASRHARVRTDSPLQTVGTCDCYIVTACSRAQVAYIFTRNMPCISKI
jgi:hypothetical protein